MMQLSKNIETIKRYLTINVQDIHEEILQYAIVMSPQQGLDSIRKIIQKDHICTREEGYKS